VSPKLPPVSGKQLIKALEKLGYQVMRQKGSHVILRKTSPAGNHTLTIPNHSSIAKGTLNDILSKVALWNNISKEDLLKSL